MSSPERWINKWVERRLRAAPTTAITSTDNSFLSVPGFFVCSLEAAKRPLSHSGSWMLLKAPEASRYLITPRSLTWTLDFLTLQVFWLPFQVAAGEVYSFHARCSLSGRHWSVLKATPVCLNVVVSTRKCGSEICRMCFGFHRQHCVCVIRAPLGSPATRVARVARTLPGSCCCCCCYCSCWCFFWLLVHVETGSGRRIKASLGCVP